MSPALLSARDIVKRYPSAGWWNRRDWVMAVDEVDLHIEAGESVGLVGESGSGKTTLARIIAGLIDPDAGLLLWRGRNLKVLDAVGRTAYRREVQYVFQNPIGALNPRHRIGPILERTLRGLTGLDAPARRARIDTVAEQVGLEQTLYGRFPHQLSGGQVQRVAIARALLGEPRLLVLDEPVSALDVSLQAQILNLLEMLRCQQGLAYLLISHDLTVIERLCTRIAVMRNGVILEQGSRERIMNDPQNRYTSMLLEAVPKLHRA
ncbi:MAG: ATP-binding cassette domain-containing protein [Thiohalocapsa sp.]